MDQLNWGMLFSPACIWIFIPLTAVVGGLLLAGFQLYTRHVERMAMIDAGLHPDHPDSKRVFQHMGASQPRK